MRPLHRSAAADQRARPIYIVDCSAADVEAAGRLSASAPTESTQCESNAHSLTEKAVCDTPDCASFVLAVWQMALKVSDPVDTVRQAAGDPSPPPPHPLGTAMRAGRITIESMRSPAALIARSPYVVISSAAEDGGHDVSPKGDAPGFVAVHDDKTLIIPDRLGKPSPGHVREPAHRSAGRAVVPHPRPHGNAADRRNRADRPRRGAEGAIRGERQASRTRPRRNGGAGVHALLEIAWFARNCGRPKHGSMRMTLRASHSG